LRRGHGLGSAGRDKENLKEELKIEGSLAAVVVVVVLLLLRCR
jgi:hypothetical protein